MGRRVAVTVDADTGPYVDSIAEATAVTKEAKAEIGALGREADDTGRDMDKLAGETALAKKEVGDLGDKANKAQRDLAALDRRIASVKRSVNNLGFEFAATGDVVAGKKFGDQQSLLGKLERLKSELEGMDRNGSPLTDILGGLGRAAKPVAAAAETSAEVVKDTSSVASNSTSILDSVPEAKQMLIGALVVGAVAAAPAIGAVIAGAVTGVVGLGGIAGGIFAASHDPKVKAAASDFGQSISAQFFGSGTSFVNPVIESLGILDRDFGKLNLSETFKIAAPYVTKVADGLGKMAISFMPGFNKALEEAGPVIDELAMDLPRIGEDFGDMFATIAGNKGTVDGLAAAFGALDFAINFAGGTVSVLTNAFEGELDSVRGLEIAYKDVTVAVGLGGLQGAISTTGTALAGFAAGMTGVLTPTTLAAAATRAMTVELQNLDKATRDYLQLANSMADAELADAAAFLALNEGLKKGAKNWDDNTKAGLNNLTLQQQAIEAAQRVRDAAIDAAKGSVDAIRSANQAYNSEIDRILAVGAAAGESKPKLDAIAGTYKIDVNVTSNAKDVIAGVNQALASLGRSSTKVGPLNRGQSGLLGFASGGDPPPGMSWVGEHGKELVDFAGREHVYNHQQSMAMARVSSSSIGAAMSGGTQRVVLELDPSITGANRDIASALITMLRLKRAAGYDF